MGMRKVWNGRRAYRADSRGSQTAGKRKSRFDLCNAALKDGRGSDGSSVDVWLLGHRRRRSRLPHT